MSPRISIKLWPMEDGWTWDVRRTEPNGTVIEDKGKAKFYDTTHWSWFEEQNDWCCIAGCPPLPRHRRDAYQTLYNYWRSDK